MFLLFYSFEYQSGSTYCWLKEEVNRLTTSLLAGRSGWLTSPIVGHIQEQNMESIGNFTPMGVLT